MGDLRAVRRQGRLLALEGVEASFRRLLLAPRPHSFGNGRFVGHVFEEAVTRQALRIAAVSALAREVVTQLRPEDLPDPPSATGRASGTGLYLWLDHLIKSAPATVSRPSGLSDRRAVSGFFHR